MLRSMYSGVSGLKAHQTKMDVIGNNIANINTVGYKSSRVNFKDMLSQTMLAASAPAEDGSRGGMNPQQVGLGVQVGSIDVNHEQGNLQPTGNNTDLAIDGDGFFVVSDGSENFYTRAGALSLDEDGTLVNSANGLKVQGWEADPAGNIDTDQSAADIIIPMGTSKGALATSEARFGQNLNSEVEIGTTRTATIDVYDSLGAKHTASVQFTKNGDNEWGWEAVDITDADNFGANSGTIQFTDEGRFDSVDNNTIQFDPAGTTSGAAAPQEIEVDFSGLIQYADSFTVDGLSANGYPKGELNSFSIDSLGIIQGSYSNGLTQPIGQIALASFNNPAGLSKEGESLYRITPNSGIAQIGEAASAGRGSLAPATLEMSNVDLAEQFTEMITAQRGFQSNSQAITTSDEMLQTLVNMKR